VEIVYQPRMEWPRDVTDAFHRLHLEHDTQNPKCPYCNGTWKWAETDSDSAQDSL
jgi:hypothetical protein